MDYDFWITMGTAAILASIKNEVRKANLKKVCLKLFLSIGRAFINDPDFQAAVESLKPTA